MTDTDGDGTPDYVDDVSDNDSIPDYREAGDLALDTAPADNDQERDTDSNGDLQLEQLLGVQFCRRFASRDFSRDFKRGSFLEEVGSNEGP